ncbi:hypothetical protein [Streptomyces ardesiacus]|uniref:Uncharacterized protein n=1 Tax=Streptomyces ardesiacus TaxID=285564 RepID=A0ABW8H2K7_9ACTN
MRGQCTSSKTGGRTLCVQPREVQEVLDHARLQQGDEQWRAKYGTRAVSSPCTVRPFRRSGGPGRSAGPPRPGGGSPSEQRRSPVP